jgi:hypothetical protein
MPGLDRGIHAAERIGGFPQENSGLSREFMRAEFAAGASLPVIASRSCGAAIQANGGMPPV